MDKKYKTLEGVIANMRSSNVDFIQQYQNALSQNMCDYFINKFENLDKKGLTNEGRVQTLIDGKVENFINSEAKSSKDIYLSSTDEENKFNMRSNKKDKEMFDGLASIINRHIYLYSLHVGIERPEYMGVNKSNFHTYFKSKNDCPKIHSNISVDSICLRKYEKNKGGYYYPHYDNKSSFYRIMAIIIYLNDIQYGGETEFPALNKMIIPKRGNLVIFPSVFTHWHYGRKSNIDKYVLVSHVSKYPSKTEEKEKE
tara:strand:+ start:964 stop:1728 length:765 start_codon:yes stop_codon:yes gene_type:complete